MSSQNFNYDAKLKLQRIPTELTQRRRERGEEKPNARSGGIVLNDDSSSRRRIAIRMLHGFSVFAPRPLRLCVSGLER
jgi:hypothetical protein